MRGEQVCGDAVAIVRGDGHVLVAVVDGLGHGPQAAAAARALCAFAEGNAGKPLERLVEEATRAISDTRGAAAAFLDIDRDGGVLRFCGIGNIEAQAVSRAPIRPICMPGIIGRPLRKILAFEYALAPGDLLLLHTDGVSSRFSLSDFAGGAPQEIADAVLERHGKDHDDATCVVIRLRGGQDD